MNRLFLSIMIFGSFLIFGVAEGADWALITKGQSNDIDVFVGQESVKRISDTERKYKILQSEGYFADGTRETDLSERQGYILPDDVAYKYLCK